MMRELLNKFSGRQLTALAIAALFVPGALGAAVVFQPVSIVDPNTGTKSFVDLGRRLYVHDPIAGYTNNPGNIVNVTQGMFSNNAAFPLYTTPTGKAFVIKSAQFSYFGNADRNNIYLYLTNTSGHTMAVVEALETAGTLHYSYDPGIVVASGQQLMARFGSTDGQGGRYALLTLQGYLVPAASLPAALSLEAAGQFIQAGPSVKQDPKPRQ